MLGELGAKQVGLGHLDTQGAFGQEVHLIDQDLDDGAKGQCHHRQVGAGHAQRGQRQQRTKASGHANTGRNDEPQGRAELEEHDTRGVRAHAKQASVAERHLAGVADHNVQPEQQDGVNHDRADHVDVVGVVEVKRRGAQERQRDKGHGKRLAVHLQTFLMAVLPNRPAGLNASTSNNSTKPGTSL